MNRYCPGCDRHYLDESPHDRCDSCLAFSRSMQRIDLQEIQRCLLRAGILLEAIAMQENDYWRAITPETLVMIDFMKNFLDRTPHESYLTPEKEKP